MTSLDCSRFACSKFSSLLLFDHIMFSFSFFLFEVIVSFYFSFGSINQKGVEIENNLIFLVNGSGKKRS